MQATGEGRTTSLRDWDVGDGCCARSQLSPTRTHLAAPCPADLKPPCICQAQTFPPSVHLTNALSGLLSPVPVLVIALFGKSHIEVSGEC